TPVLLVSSQFFALFSLSPSRAMLFPYTTLFRSSVRARTVRVRAGRGHGAGSGLPSACAPRPGGGRASRGRRRPGRGGERRKPSRSEEHTSELQSRENLVCRLLLEKKKSQSAILA